MIVSPEFMVVTFSVLWTYQVVPLEVVKSLFTACKSGDFDIANKEVDNIVAEGYPASQIINQVFLFPSIIYHTFDSRSCGYNLKPLLIQLSFQLFDIVVEAGDDITDKQKAEICKCLGETDKVRSLTSLVLVTYVWRLKWDQLPTSQFPLFPCIQRLVDGADEYLQLLEVASNTIRALSQMAQDF